MYLQESSQYSKEGLGLENQRTLAKYIRDYLTDPHKSADLIPANTGIADEYRGTDQRVQQPVAET